METPVLSCESGQPPELGKKAIQESNQRWAAVPAIKVVSYVPETEDITILDGWAVEWGITGPYVERRVVRSSRFVERG